MLNQWGIPLLEMANAIQKYTGLPGVIYFSTVDQLKNKQSHSLGRIKWIHGDKVATISIKKDPKDGKRIFHGDRSMLNDLEKFISKNEDILWDYWNTPSHLADSAETMQRFRK